MDSSKIPTEGGSYVRQDDGTLKKAQGTEPAPPPVNRASPDEPHPDPAAPPPVMPLPDPHTAPSDAPKAEEH